MDETMKIYMPRKQLPIMSHEEASAAIAKKVKHVTDHKSKWKRFCDYIFDSETWKSVLRENAEQERELDQKYPWFELLHKYITVLCAIILSIALIFWGIASYANHVAENRGNEVAEQKDKEHQAYIDQQEADRQAAEQTLEKQMQKNATVKAKGAYGSHAFKENRNYGEADFMTFFQCVDNRLKNLMYAGMTIEQIVFQEGQFLSSYETNPLQDYYYNLAMKSERLKHEREVNNLPEPVGSDYVYLVYTDHGLYLTNDPNAPSYLWWRYSE